MLKENPEPYVISILPHYASSPNSKIESGHTLRCLKAISESKWPNLDIIVVDSGSQDDLHVNFRNISDRSVRYLRIEDNLGYAASMNLAAKHALDQKPDYVFLINNDTVLSPDTIGDLVGFVSQHPNIATANPKVYTLSKGAQKKTREIETLGGRFIGGNFGGWQEDHGQYNFPFEIDFASGIAMLVRAEIIRKIGLFDPKFFIWYEDLDFGIRVKKAGFKAYYVPSPVWHEGAQSVRHRYSPKLAYYSTRNLIYTIRKYDWIWKTVLMPRFISVESKTIFGALFIEKNPQSLLGLIKGFRDGVTDKL